MLGEFLAKFRSNFVVGLSIVTVGGCEAFQVRYGFNERNRRPKWSAPPVAATLPFPVEMWDRSDQGFQTCDQNRLGVRAFTGT